MSSQRRAVNNGGPAPAARPYLAGGGADELAGEERGPCLDHAKILAHIFFLKRESRMHGVLNEVYLKYICKTFSVMDVTFRDESNDGN